MINKIRSKLLRPEKGWDPIPPEYVAKYGEKQWLKFNTSSVDDIENKIGPLIDREVIDLGAGPGQYTYEFAKRGSKVTWYDISKHYQDFSRAKFINTELRHPVEFHIGYFEESLRLNKTFDFVFNRICWCYCMDDFNFAAVLYGLLKEGGWAHCIVNHLGFYSNKPLGFRGKLKIFLNESFGIKLGYTHPSTSRVQSAIAMQSFKRIEYEITSDNIYVWVQR